MVSVYTLVGYVLVVWAIVLIVADLLAVAAPAKRTAAVFWYLFAIWLAFAYLAWPVHR